MDAKNMQVMKIKSEPDALGYAEFENSYALGVCSTDLNGDALLNFTLDGYKSPPVTKHTSSPAQEATRSRINTCDGQLKKLYKQRAAGKLDSKGVMQIRCLEEDLRKAHAKLRRLLNEAERQRRRRERLRCGLSASPIAAASQASKMLMIVGGSGRHGYDGLPTITSYGTHQSEVVPYGCQDDGVLAALKQCTRFDEFVRELNTLGFSLNRVQDESQVVYDVTEDGEDAADGDIRVQVELLEGDAALEQSMTVEEESEIQVVKPEPLTPPSCSPSPSENPVPEERLKEITGKDKDQVTDGSRLSAKVPSSSAKVLAAEYARRHSLCHREWQEQYQQWYERQVEAQQQWEENFMREQMELTKSMLDNVTSTLLQGMQQVMQNIMGTVGRRTMTPFVPNFQMRNGVELNGLSINHSDMFINPDAATNGSD